MIEREIIYYQTEEEKIPYRNWFDALRDIKAQQIITRRVNQAALGNFGDHRNLPVGVVELKIQYGPGYRIYLGRDGDTLIVLLLGGDKSSQQQDISKAKAYWENYKKRR